MGNGRRGAETGSGFQELINRTNEAYERSGRAFITRKSIPGKYIIERGVGRRGLALPDSGSVAGLDRLPAGAVSQLVRQQRSGDSRRFVPESRGEPDYGGVLAPVGRAIFYDAKSTRRDVLDFDNLHPHQVAFLERSASHGAIAGFLVEFSLRQAVYFLPIQVLLRWRSESARKSFPFGFFDSFFVPASPGVGMIIYDYLAAIERQESDLGHDFSRLTIPG